MSTILDPQSSNGALQGKAPPKKRSSKACETCRVRRIRCVGPPPCEQCTAVGLGVGCVVRAKARPRRAPSAKVFMRNDVAIEAPAHLERPIASPTMVDKRNPLDDLEVALGVWCSSRGVPFSQLVFKEYTRLTGLQGPPLPPQPMRQEFEDQLLQDLIRTSIDSESFDHRKAAGDTNLQSLYARYRALPNSLTDDQSALIYAVLCASRFNQFRDQMNSGDPVPDEERQDVTYYHMAYAALAKWNQPSIVAMWALFYLTPFTLGMGAASETKDLLTQMAYQIRELGLHRHATASLYQPQDQVVFAAFFYTEMFRSSLIDLRPIIAFSEIDVDPSPPAQMFPEHLVRASHATAQFLADYTDPTVDTTSVDYISAAESSWMPTLRDLRHGTQEVSRATVSWAQFRYNWLRAILYLPLITHATRSAMAYTAITRAVTQILYAYSDLVSIQQLKPSWPQVQRLVVTGQLLILCHEAGELHRREAEILFQLMLDLLAQHQTLFPVCLQLIGGFAAAAASFGIEVGPQTGIAFPLASDRGPVESHPLGWPFTFGFDFDLGEMPF